MLSSWLYSDQLCAPARSGVGPAPSIPPVLDPHDPSAPGEVAEGGWGEHGGDSAPHEWQTKHCRVQEEALLTSMFVQAAEEQGYPLGERTDPEQEPVLLCQPPTGTSHLHCPCVQWMRWTSSLCLPMLARTVRKPACTTHSRKA